MTNVVREATTKIKTALTTTGDTRLGGKENHLPPTTRAVVSPPKASIAPHHTAVGSIAGPDGAFSHFRAFSAKRK